MFFCAISQLWVIWNGDVVSLWMGKEDYRRLFRLDFGRLPCLETKRSSASTEEWEHVAIDTHQAVLRVGPQFRSHRAKVLLSVSAALLILRRRGRRAANRVRRFLTWCPLQRRRDRRCGSGSCGGPSPRYSPEEREYILSQARRQPDRESMEPPPGP